MTPGVCGFAWRPPSCSSRAACGLSHRAHPKRAPAAVSPEAASIDSPVHTQHSITVEGGQLDYTATAGTLRVRPDKVDAEAAVFYVSYRKDGEDAATRPITFVFNGGPGSSAAWLHMGGARAPAACAQRRRRGPHSLRPGWSTTRRPGCASPISSSSIRSAPGSAAPSPRGKAAQAKSGAASGASRAICALWPSSSVSTSPATIAGHRPSIWRARATAGFVRQCSSTPCLHRRESNSTERFSSHPLSTTRSTFTSTT